MTTSVSSEFSIQYLHIVMSFGFLEHITKRVFLFHAKAIFEFGEQQQEYVTFYLISRFTSQHILFFYLF